MNLPKICSRFLLAPMAGINDVAFRLLCRECNAGLVYTEMVSANALSRGNKATLSLLDFTCPATKIIKEGAGSALLNRPGKIREIITNMVKVSSVPITAKIRAGINFKNIVAVDVAKIIEDAGASAIAVHGRVAIQGYAGRSEWKHIKDVKDALNIPVIGNGDADSPESAKGMIDETGCDYVMIGRAARGNPYVFRQCDDYFKNKSYTKYDSVMRLEMFGRYLDYAKDFNIQFQQIKIHANYYTKGIIGGAKVRGRLARVKNIEDIRELFNL